MSVCKRAADIRGSFVSTRGSQCKCLVRSRLTHARFFLPLPAGHLLPHERGTRAEHPRLRGEPAAAANRRAGDTALRSHGEPVPSQGPSSPERRPSPLSSGAASAPAPAAGPAPPTGGARPVPPPLPAPVSAPVPVPAPWSGTLFPPPCAATVGAENTRRLQPPRPVPPTPRRPIRARTPRRQPIRWRSGGRALLLLLLPPAGPAAAPSPSRQEPRRRRAAAVRVPLSAAGPPAAAAA